MRNKSRLYSASLVLLLLLLVSSTVSCMCGGLIVTDSHQEYIDETNSVMEDWASVINDWDEAANDDSRLPYLDLDAEECADRMQAAISSWDDINPPDDAEEYHTWIRLAMDYEKNAFGMLAEYYSLGEGSSSAEFNQLHSQTTDLWVLKDQALFQAMDVAPEWLK